MVPKEQVQTGVRWHLQAHWSTWADAHTCTRACFHACIRQLDVCAALAHDVTRRTRSCIPVPLKHACPL